MLHLMDTDDLAQYFAHTYVEYDDKIVYVTDASTVEGHRALYAPHLEGWVHAEDVKPFFPPTCAVSLDGRMNILGDGRAARDYKRSYRGHSGDTVRLEQLLTKVLNKDWLSFNQAVEVCHSKAEESTNWAEVFGRGCFSLKVSDKYNVIILRHLRNDIGYLFGNNVVISNMTPAPIINKLRKELGHERVLFED